MKANHEMRRCVPTPEEREFLEDRLYEYNLEQTGQDDGDRFGFFIRNGEAGPDGEIIVGLAGWTWARACEIEELWVHPNWRGHGYGKQLLQSAEEYARAHGVEIIFIDSYSFQAPGFYRKNGYEQAFELDGFPPGYRWSFLVKRLAS